jgi:regulator of protease activity HflC (stomatin/prohibitin superfamily)
MSEETKERRSYLMEVLILLMVVAVLFLAFWDSMVVQIPAGHKGVLFRNLGEGTVLDRTWGEGVVLILPWNEMTVYDNRVLSGQDTIDALTSDGLRVNAELSYRYRPLADSLGALHQLVGDDYAEKVLIPHIAAATRDVVSRYRVDDLYNTSRDDIQADMLSQVRSQVDAYYPVRTIDLIVRNIKLDSVVERAIADKLVREQDMLSYDYLIERQEKESERSDIEARTYRRFERLSGIDLLKIKGIEATRELAKSPNSKIIFLGTDSKELPVIFGGN